MKGGDFEKSLEKIVKNNSIFIIISVFMDFITKF